MLDRRWSTRLAADARRALLTREGREAAGRMLPGGDPRPPEDLDQVRDADPAIAGQVGRARRGRCVHKIKLVEALSRLRRVDDALCRSVAAQWFELV
jgi:hypothetical protein